MSLETVSLELGSPAVLGLLVLREVNTGPGKGMAQRMVQAATESGTDNQVAP